MVAKRKSPKVVVQLKGSGLFTKVSAAKARQMTGSGFFKKARAAKARQMTGSGFFKKIGGALKKGITAPVRVAVAPIRKVVGVARQGLNVANQLAAQANAMGIPIPPKIQAGLATANLASDRAKMVGLGRARTSTTAGARRRRTGARAARNVIMY